MYKIKEHWHNYAMILAFVFAGICAVMFLYNVYIYYLIGSFEIGSFEQVGNFEGNSTEFQDIFDRRVPPHANFGKELYSATVLFITFTGMIISGVSGFALHDLTRKKEKKEIKAKIVKSVLMDDEKKIINILEENDGEMKQSELVKKSNLTKLKVSRAIRRLEQMKMVSKHQYGITNKIILEKDDRDDDDENDKKK